MTLDTLQIVSDFKPLYLARANDGSIYIIDLRDGHEAMYCITDQAREIGGALLALADGMPLTAISGASA